jgi:hypothetical protein
LWHKQRHPLQPQAVVDEEVEAAELQVQPRRPHRLRPQMVTLPRPLQPALLHVAEVGEAVVHAVEILPRLVLHPQLQPTAQWRHPFPPLQPADAEAEAVPLLQLLWK